MIHERLDREGITGVSLRVGVPHYLANAQHPKSSAALLRHLEHVLGVPTAHGAMYEEIQRWEELHNASVEGDEQVSKYLEMLEREYDRRTEAMMPSVTILPLNSRNFCASKTTAEKISPQRKEPPAARCRGSSRGYGPKTAIALSPLIVLGPYSEPRCTAHH